MFDPLPVKIEIDETIIEPKLVMNQKHFTKLRDILLIIDDEVEKWKLHRVLSGIQEE